MINIKNLLIISAIIIFVGCGKNENQEVQQVHEHPAISVTQYTDATEIFMEYPTLVINEEAKFLIHLTDLKDFKAVTQGKLAIEFKSNTGVKVNYIIEEPTRPGIYIPSVTLSKPGIYTMTMEFDGNQVSDIIVVQDIIVYSGEIEVPHNDEQESASISFLKEQQWKIEFANEPVTKRKMQKSVIASGEIIAKPEYYSKVVSPVSGIVLNKNNTSLKTVGTFVKKGSTLLNISPSADVGNNIQKLKSDYLLAKSELERIESLYKLKAVSKKRFVEASFDLEAKSLSYNSVSELVNITEKGYSILAPISGYIQDVYFPLGSQIESGHELFTIVNPSKLLLKANVPSSQSDVATNSIDASFKVEGMEEEYSIKKLNGKRISISAGINKSNRTISVYYEFDNPKNRIKIGMYAEAFLKDGNTSEYTSIPESAIINEDGIKTAYVQLEGESFDRRILTIGVIDNGYVQVLDGLNVGERVVTKGAYQVRLVSLSPDSEIGHGHVH